MMNSKNNFLKAVFWDCPELTDPEVLKEKLSAGEGAFRDWALSRFLEHGRVIDTMEFFDISEIEKKLGHLKISPYSRKKWKRMTEVYG